MLLRFWVALTAYNPVNATQNPKAGGWVALCNTSGRRSGAAPSECPLVGPGAGTVRSVIDDNSPDGGGAATGEGGRHNRSAAVVIVDPPAEGRPTTTVRVPPAGCAPDRRARLDTLLRLCDVALWDLDVPTEPAPGAVWVVRRTTLEVRRWPIAAERVTVDTWCSAVGRVWAERRIDLVGGLGGDVRMATLWASLDRSGARPARLAPELVEAGPTRRVAIGLSHPAPPAEASVGPWPIRRSDIDVLDHVNNSVIWTAFEDTEAGAAAKIGDGGGRYEAEYRSQLFHGPAELTVAPGGDQVWLSAPGETPAASLRSLA